MQLSRSVRPKNTLPLLTSTVKMDADDPVVRCAFRCGGLGGGGDGGGDGGGCKGWVGVNPREGVTG